MLAAEALLLCSPYLRCLECNFTKVQKGHLSLAGLDQACWLQQQELELGQSRKAANHLALHAKLKALIDLSRKPTHEPVARPCHLQVTHICIKDLQLQAVHDEA